MARDRFLLAGFVVWVLCFGTLIAASSGAPQDPAPRPSVVFDCPPPLVPTVKPDGTRLSITCEAKGTPTPTPTPIPTPAPTPKPTPTPVPASLGGLYVAPNGLPTNAGTQTAPLDLATAISATSPAKPGDTIWLRAGTYASQWKVGVKGDAGKPVTIRAFPGERAILQTKASDFAVLSMETPWVYVWGVEITCPDADRTAQRVTGVYMTGPNCKLINCVIHDVGSGFGSWTQATDNEVSGCIFYRNGWQGAPPDRGHGHSGYLQSASAEHPKVVRDNVVFDSFGLGLQCYAQSTSLVGIRIENNTIFDSGSMSAPAESGYENILVAGIVPADQITITGNVLYHPLKIQSTTNLSLYFQSVKNGDVQIKDNYITGGDVAMWLQEWQSGSVTGNTFVSANNLVTVGLAGFPSAFAWNNNSYFGAIATPFNWRTTSFGYRTLADWKTLTGFDANSAYTTGKPLVNKVVVRVNAYDSARGTITVVNWTGAASITVDLLAILKSGQPYAIFNVRNLDAAVLSGNYAGSVALPISGEFGAFLVVGR